MDSINVYRITSVGSLPFVTQASTLDEVTSQLKEGFYTTFRTFDNGKRALGLNTHLQRLFQPLSLRKVDTVVTKKELRRQLNMILQARHGEARVRLVMTKTGEVYAAITNLKLLPPEIYEKGVMVCTTELQRSDPRLKATGFIHASEHKREEILHNAFFEALLVRNGLLLEGMTSNFFYIRDGKLGTAREHVLLGVTRRMVLRVARRLGGLEIVFLPLKQNHVGFLSEAFLTSSSRGIVPIVKIDDVTVGEGAPGPFTIDLMRGYEAYVMQHAELI